MRGIHDGGAETSQREPIDLGRSPDGPAQNQNNHPSETKKKRGSVKRITPFAQHIDVSPSKLLWLSIAAASAAITHLLSTCFRDGRPRGAAWRVRHRGEAEERRRKT